MGISLTNVELVHEVLALHIHLGHLIAILLDDVLVLLPRLHHIYPIVLLVEL